MMWQNAVTHRPSTHSFTDDDVRYAYVRQPNGMVRKEQARSDWQAATCLRKSKDENLVQR